MNMEVGISGKIRNETAWMLRYSPEGHECEVQATTYHSILHCMTNS